MTTLYHWGKWIDSEVPVTGVLSINSINWDFYDFNDEICLTCEEIIAGIQEDDSLSDEEKESKMEYIECDSSHEKITGDWAKNEKGLYIPDKTKEFAAIVRESVVQVVWSKFTTRGAPCSPCYAGQIDLDSKGDYLAYTLPEDMIYKG